MNAWMSGERLAPIIQPYSFIALAALTLIGWLFYKTLLRGVSAERHDNLRRRFSSVVAAIIGGVAVSQLAYWNGVRHDALSLLLLGLGIIASTRLVQIYLYLFLFRASMQLGVPRLIVNLFTFVYLTLVTSWLAAEVFGVRLGPLLATSAAFSVILGLALQDTLGNLLSGLALQLDRSYVLGDWVEVQHGSQRWTGQVQEITWRATFLKGFLGELITIPNRTIGQSEVVLLSPDGVPMRRGQVFRFAFDADDARVREILANAASGVDHVLASPVPQVLVTDVSESFVVYKVFYSIDDPGMQYTVGDVIYRRVLQASRTAGLAMGQPSLRLVS